MARTSAEKMEELSGSLTFEVCKLEYQVKG